MSEPSKGVAIVRKINLRKAASDRAEALSNADLAELLAREGDTAEPPLTKAFRRAWRHALLWPEEASQLFKEGRPFEELSGIGPYLSKIIRGWFQDPPALSAPPHLRSHFLSLTQAELTESSDPSWLSGLRGDLQMHSEWSDGSSSIREMADAAVERNYDYIAITDHSKGLKIAGGIGEDQLKQQADEIGDVNRTLAQSGKKLTVLRSIELNLNPRGEGDMADAALSELDLVLGCFHSSLRRKEDQTARYLAALGNPAIQILGHPRGRIYNFRLGLTADWPRVFATAAELDKAVEIDAYPDRQDLSLDLLSLAKTAGCRISLGTDSHGPSQLRFIVFAAAAAIRAGIRRDRIVNFMSSEALLHWVGSVRESTARGGRAYARAT